MRALRYIAVLALATTVLQSCRGTPYASGSASSGGFTVSGGIGAPPPSTVDYGATEASLNGNIANLTEALAQAEDPESMDKILAGLALLLEQKESIARLVAGTEEEA